MFRLFAAILFAACALTGAARSEFPERTILLVSALSEVQNFYYLNVPYDALIDLVPVGKIADGPPLVLIVNAKSPFKSVADLIAYERRIRRTLTSRRPASRPRRRSPFRS